LKRERHIHRKDDLAVGNAENQAEEEESKLDDKRKRSESKLCPRGDSRS
jgi:hypothetical protein